MKKNKGRINETGFTLVELMMTMLISTFITAALYSAYKVQQKHATAQEQVTDMQQSIRVGMGMVVRELRNAGFDPTDNAKAGIKEISDSAVVFTTDYNGDGDTGDNDDDKGENIGFSIDTSGGFPILERYSQRTLPTIAANNTISGSQPLAEYIEQIEFLYLDEDGTETPTFKKIRSVQVSMLARARYPDRTFINGTQYVPASGLANAWGAYNDNYRRRLLITNVRVRNAGLVSK